MGKLEVKDMKKYFFGMVILICMICLARPSVMWSAGEACKTVEKTAQRVEKKLEQGGQKIEDAATKAAEKIEPKIQEVHDRTEKAVIHAHERAMKRAAWLRKDNESNHRWRSGRRRVLCGAPAQIG
jgi:hypothetical protein